MTLSLTGCAAKRATQEAVALPTLAQVAEDAKKALAEAEKLPEQPADCRKKESSGVKKGDRLDAAYLKAERALQRQNDRTGRCASWYDRLRSGS